VVAAGRLNVLQVVLSLNPGGTERLVLELARRTRADVETAVCCLDQRGAWAETLVADGIPVVSLDRQPGFTPSIGRRIGQFARERNIDVLHCHQYSPFVYGCVAKAWRPRLGIVFTEHGRLSDAPPSTKRRLINPILSRVPDRIFAVSENLKHHMVAEGLSEGRVGVIHNGIDIGPAPGAGDRARVRAVLGLRDTTFLAGTIARLDPVKDYATLIDAVARLRARYEDSALLIVGDGPERNALEAAAAKSGSGAAIIFLGHRDDARDWLAGCDVYVNSSISEGISLTILEGMAAGLPVVATGVGGTPEIVDGSCGRLVPARDPEALANALAELAGDSSRRVRLGQGARQRVESAFTLDRMVQQYVRVYREVA
jgi:L-malate glycosyltransferase